MYHIQCPFFCPAWISWSAWSKELSCASRNLFKSFFITGLIHHVKQLNFSSVKIRGMKPLSCCKMVTSQSTSFVPEYEKLLREYECRRGYSSRCFSVLLLKFSPLVVASGGAIQYAGGIFWLNHQGAFFTWVVVGAYIAKVIPLVMAAAWAIQYIWGRWACEVRFAFFALKIFHVVDCLKQYSQGIPPNGVVVIFSMQKF